MKTHGPPQGDHQAKGVQIPLWSMKTVSSPEDYILRHGSDSSMVDENYQARLESNSGGEFRFLYGRWKRQPRCACQHYSSSSDSSMVDENYSEQGLLDLDDWVQIPLWSMKTIRSWEIIILYLRFRFLYGRWKRLLDATADRSSCRSDSSMVDENYGKRHHRSWCRDVQIPLWSMKTRMQRVHQLSLREFRFLYGRWKLRKLPWPKAVR